MLLNDYSNPNENIIFASLEKDLTLNDGSVFLSQGTNPVFEEDPIIGKYVHIQKSSYLHIDNPNLAVGTGDFTLDYWAYSIANYCVVANHTLNGNSGYTLNASQQLFVVGVSFASDPNVYRTESINARPNEWAHYALVRKNGIVYAFVNGQLSKTTPINFNFTSKQLAVNGAVSNTPQTYCVSNNKYKAVRVCGFARWTDDFTPPNPKNIDGGGVTEPIDMNLFIKLGIQEKVNLLGYILPVPPNVQQLVWSSDDVHTAAVDSNGVVTGVAVGKTTIRVKTLDGSWSAFARVKVVDKASNGLRLSILLKLAESCELDTAFIPENNTLPVIWSSSNLAIASVNSEGKVTGIAEGVTVISAKTIDDKFFDFIYVTVKS